MVDGNQEKDIAVIIEAPVQFFSVKSLIDRLIEQGRSVDLIVPYLEDYKVVTRAAKRVLSDLGYEYISTGDIANVKYKVCIAPYAVVNFAKINTKYRIRYDYSILSSKPNPTYKPVQRVWFDAIVCNSPQEAELMKAYTQTYTVSPMKYDGFEKIKRVNTKPMLLYMPTYGDVSSADQAEQIITALKEKFYVVVRMHAHIAHKRTDEEAVRYKTIKRLADEVCDDTTQIVDWLKIADVALSDNSGSIYEAIYSKTPVAVFTDNVKALIYGNILPLHSKLIDQKIIPYSRDISDIVNIVESAMSPAVFSKQMAARKSYFKTTGRGVDEFLEIIERYLRDEINQERWWLHQNYADEYYTMRSTAHGYDSILREKNELEKQLEYFKKAKAHRVVSWLYVPYRKLRGILK